MLKSVVGVDKMRSAARRTAAAAALVLTVATLTAAASSSEVVDARDDSAVTAFMGQVDTPHPWVDHPDFEPYEFCAYEGSTCSCNGAARWGYTGGEAPAEATWVRGFLHQAALWGVSLPHVAAVSLPPFFFNECVIFFLLFRRP